ncbi:MAG: HD domain-containing protein [Defluviitaleaceae bacterium]|nr:HD domain-containing protein [Defluviitaleaceae bacterium]
MYEKYLNNSEISKIIDAINEMHRGSIVSCHGRGHAMRVVAAAEQILVGLNFDARTVEMGKIAALLHDIGNIAGRRKHAKKSAALAKIFLSREDFLRRERDAIVQAIVDHSEGKKISSAIGAALIIADKIDISRRRIFPLSEPDVLHKNLLELEDVTLSISEKIISINYIGTKKFSKELLMREYKKGFILPMLAAEFLGCEWRILFNGSRGHELA